jgi:23S rRNA (cytosine1962-C5)-methyltransferase
VILPPKAILPILLFYLLILQIRTSKLKVILKPGKEKPIRNKHHWIFSGAISHMPSFKDGECLSVYSSQEEFLGWGYFNKRAKITGRMVSFDQTEPLEAVFKHLDAAIKMRNSLINSSDTNAYRLVNGEGDLLPGLVIDRYKDILVMQISTLGMRQMRSEIVEWLKNALSPACIYEKSILSSRKEEGLEGEEGILFGTFSSDSIEIKENGVRFLVSPKEGQKTGFFLDHREMRLYVKTVAMNKRVLNCFSYTGGFTVYAAAGGASKVDSIDISTSAVEMARKNMALNGFSGKEYAFFTADVFHYLRENSLDYDLIILDPPAFAKKQKDVVSACRGYKDINRIAIQKMPKGSLLLTSSCSYHVDEQLFQKVIFQAAVEANRMVKIISRHRMAPDHPINLCHPESDYLKTLLLYIDDVS